MTTKSMMTTLSALTLLSASALAQMSHGTHATTQNDASGLAKLSGKAFDRAYLTMMIAHHQGAVDMARAVQGRVKDAQVKTWAAAVIRDQAREISAMNTWLKPLGGIDAKMQSAIATHMGSMLAPLKSAKAADMAFVQGMLPHHASALDMANLALQKSNDVRVLKLSRDIIKAQADEMFAYRQWLAQRS